jgi:hypothetical protein
MQPPKRQPREEDKRRPDAVVPLCLINTCQHTYLSLIVQRYE